MRDSGLPDCVKTVSASFFRHSGETGCVKTVSPLFFRHSGPLFSVIPGFFFCHSGESRNPSFSCDLGIAKEREARAFYAGFRLSPE